MTLDTTQFTGSETLYRHPLCRKVTYTEGVKYVADTAGAHWLIDELAFNQPDAEFQVWKLTVQGSKATLTTDDGDGNVLRTKELDFTDFPEPGITLWLVNNTILLPSEY